VGHIACIGETRNANIILVGKLGDRMENLCVDWRIILEWIIEKPDGRV
jgi:hypothetical protein